MQALIDPVYTKRQSKEAVVAGPLTCRFGNIRIHNESTSFIMVYYLASMARHDRNPDDDDDSSVTTPPTASVVVAVVVVAVVVVVVAVAVVVVVASDTGHGTNNRRKY
jgi:hypothetical protein